MTSVSSTKNPRNYFRSHRETPPKKYEEMCANCEQVREGTRPRDPPKIIATPKEIVKKGLTIMS